MARGNDPGKDFDDQYYSSKRRGQEKARRGESHWAEDKYLERMKNQSQGPAHHGKDESCGKKTLILLGFLSGLGWFLNETVQYIA